MGVYRARSHCKGHRVLALLVLSILALPFALAAHSVSLELNQSLITTNAPIELNLTITNIEAGSANITDFNITADSAPDLNLTSLGTLDSNLNCTATDVEVNCTSLIEPQQSASLTLQLQAIDGNHSLSITSIDDAAGSSPGNSTSLLVNTSFDLAFDSNVNLTTSEVYVDLYWSTTDGTDPDTCLLSKDGTNVSATAYNTTTCYKKLISHSNQNYTLVGYANSSEGGWAATGQANIAFENLNAEIDGYIEARQPKPPSDVHEDDADSFHYEIDYRLVNGFEAPSGWNGNGWDLGGFYRKDHVDSWGNTIQDEDILCSAWGNVYNDYAENVTTGFIDEVYCHAWIHSTDFNTVVLGMSSLYTSDALDDSQEWSDTKKTWATMDAKPGSANFHNLAIYYKDGWNWTFYDNGTFWGMGFKASGDSIQILANVNQRTWCLYNTFNGHNLSDNTSLNSTDYDGDGLTDYEELWESYSNPTLADSDGDGLDDYKEYTDGLKAYAPYDWATVSKYHMDGSDGNTATWQTNNSLSTEPGPADYGAVLNTSYSGTQYTAVGTHDTTYTTFDFSNTAVFNYAITQSNFRFNISEDPADIIVMHTWLSYQYVTPEYSLSKRAYIKNIAGGSDVPLPGRDDSLGNLFRKTLYNDFSDYINATTGEYLFGISFANNRTSTTTHTVKLEDAEVWVYTPNMSLSFLSLSSPTARNTATIYNDSNFKVKFSFYDSGAFQTSDVTVQSITINGTACSLDGSAVYTTDHWEQNCTVPDLLPGQHYTVKVSAKTTSSAVLNDTEVNSVYLAAGEPPSALAFAIGLPSSGCVEGQGSTDASTDCEVCYFEPPDLTGPSDSTAVACEGQDAGTAFIAIDSQTSTTLTLTLNLNDSLASMFDLKASLSSSGYETTCSGDPSTGCVNINSTSPVTITSSLTNTSATYPFDAQLWLWADFIAATQADSTAYLATLNSSAT